MIKKIKNIINNKIIKASVWYTFTDFFLKGLNFFTIPIYTRLLSVSDYGKVSLYQTWLAIFSILITFNLKASVGRGKYEFKTKYNQYISSVLFLSLIIFILILFLSIVFNDIFYKITNLNYDIFLIMLFHSYFIFVNQYLVDKFRFEYRYKIVSLLVMLTSLLGVFLSIYFVLNNYETNKYLGIIIGKSFFVILFGIVFLIYIFFKGREFINLKYWKYALALSIPLIFHSMARIINDQFDRLVIGNYVGSSSLGVYSFAYNIGLLITILHTATAQAWTPWLFEKLNNYDVHIIKKKASIYKNIFIYCYFILLFITPEIVKNLVNEKYWEGIDLIPIIFMAGFINFLCTFELGVEYFFKKMSLVSLGTFFSCVINIILNLFFVPRYGYESAAFTTLISFSFLLFFHFFITKKIIKKNIFGFKFHFVSIIFVVLITMLFYLLKNFILIRIILILCTTMFFFIKRKKYIENYI